MISVFLLSLLLKRWLDGRRRGKGAKVAKLLIWRRPSQSVDTHRRPVLFELGLERNPLKAEGMAYIAEMLKTNDDVRELDLRFCTMHAEGMQALAEALKINTSVDRMYVLANPLGHAGAKAIVDMLPHNKSIKYIGAQDNMINEEGKQLLRDAAIQYNITIDV